MDRRRACRAACSAAGPGTVDCRGVLPGRQRGRQRHQLERRPGRIDLARAAGSSIGLLRVGEVLRSTPSARSRCRCWRTGSGRSSGSSTARGSRRSSARARRPRRPCPSSPLAAAACALAFEREQDAAALGGAAGDEVGDLLQREPRVGAGEHRVLDPLDARCARTPASRSRSPARTAGRRRTRAGTSAGRPSRPSARPGRLPTRIGPRCWRVLLDEVAVVARAVGEVVGAGDLHEVDVDQQREEQQPDEEGQPPDRARPGCRSRGDHLRDGGAADRDGLRRRPRRRRRSPAAAAR